MAYTDTNFKTKKELLKAVKAGDDVYAWQPGPFPLRAYDGNKLIIEGPQYPQPHKWYAQVTIDGENRVLTAR